MHYLLCTIVRTPKSAMQAMKKKSILSNSSYSLWNGKHLGKKISVIHIFVSIAISHYLSLSLSSAYSPPPLFAPLIPIYHIPIISTEHIFVFFSRVRYLLGCFIIINLCVCMLRFVSFTHILSMCIWVQCDVLFF